MTSPILRLDNINKSFGALPASKDVSLDLRAGEIHALIGPNGAGKSTLIKQIAGELHPDTGRIYLEEQDVTALSVAQRAKRGLARTFQVSALAMEDSALQNAMLGAIGISGHPYWPFGKALRHGELRAIAEYALERVGLAEHASTRTSELSHGQRRQLEVAVALTMKPRAFVMDEPMAGLGTQGSQALTEFLSELRNEAPILMVEHDMDAVFALADRLSVLVYGEIIATGNVDEIRNDLTVQRAYLGEEQ
ncbi:ABC transporter ATP-binding protein [Falsihalocynthiibacter sp. SS001]|uniref:ABC transporter ATP-binding protein n=1 Tax=Falsihalocynthiibacter sp. SS001 TaxID=3349698 RepID=UPI0036D2234E